MGETLLEKLRLQKLKAVRLVILIPLFLNVSLLGVAVCAAILMWKLPGSKSMVAAVVVLAVGAFLRVAWLAVIGCAQAATASAMIAEKQMHDPPESNYKSVDNDRRRWYRRWLWWSRVGILVSILQIGAACYICVMVRNNNDELRDGGGTGKWLQTLLIILPIASVMVVIVQWCTGSDVMAWRSLYKTCEDAWRAHYREMFDYCIREALCCLGRSRYYIAEVQTDEVNAIAALLGDLVAYRAVGWRHLEVLAGVALLRSRSPRPQPEDEKNSAPEAILREASILHPYAVAAYTGPLLEIGRYPFMWPIVWLYSQGFFSFWKRNRRPKLEGDNLWRGHAAAFLRHARLQPNDLLKGRVLQANREAVYFVVALHELKILLVAVRGTETCEDLLTDGLGKESELSDSDLLGLLKGPGVSDMVREQVIKTKPHFAHVGIIEAARELSMQLDNLAEDDNDAQAAADLDSIHGHQGDEVPVGGPRQGLLSELLGRGGKCEGYRLRFVGHSLGGAISALTGLRLYKRYPDLHVYAFGVLPCLDFNTAEACESFITSVVYNDEFSSRLSVASIMRLRAAALIALGADTKKPEPTAQPCLGGREPVVVYSGDSGSSSSHHSSQSTAGTSHEPCEGLPLAAQKQPDRRKRRRFPDMFKGGLFLCAHTCFCVLKMSRHHKATSISSEIDRAVHSLTKQQNRDICINSDLCWPRDCKDCCLEMGIDRPILHPPVVNIILPSNNNGVDESGGDTSPETTMQPDEQDDSEESFRSSQSIWRQRSIEEVEAGEKSDESTGTLPWGNFEESTGRYSQGPKDSQLRRNGMPNDIGAHYLGYETGSDLQEHYKAEMFLPGKVIHLIREEKPTATTWKSSFWYTWRADGNPTKFCALVVDRKKFRNIVISPAMFIDHMPWKCQHALNLILRDMNSLERGRFPEIV